jgi:hypothetical protein
MADGLTNMSNFSIIVQLRRGTKLYFVRVENGKGTHSILPPFGWADRRNCWKVLSRSQSLRE